MATTPILSAKQKKITCDVIKSPPTPHRIELRSESIEDKSDQINKFSLKNVRQPPKSRRK